MGDLLAEGKFYRCDPDQTENQSHLRMLLASVSFLFSLFFFFNLLNCFSKYWLEVLEGIPRLGP